VLPPDASWTLAGGIADAELLVIPPSASVPAAVATEFSAHPSSEISGHAFRLLLHRRASVRAMR
jgi:hypothetical protein